VNARIALAAGALAVTALVVVLVVKIRANPAEQASASAAGAAGEESGTGGTAGGPRRMSSGVADAAPLPTPAEVAESKQRVESEHVRSPSHAPHILDNHLDAQPLREARKAMAKGDYEAALKAAEDALAVEPSNNARVMAVMAACSLGNRAKAQAHADQLDEMRKSRVAVRCKKLGIEIKGAKPIDDAEL
jgi:hypothetical protein